MSEQVKSVLDGALKLSESDHGEVAARLMESLDSPSDPGAEDAWAQEIRQRLDDVRTGREKPVPWEEARRRIVEDGDE